MTDFLDTLWWARFLIVAAVVLYAAALVAERKMENSDAK